MSVFSSATVGLFAQRGIDPKIAARHGVQQEGEWLVYPTGKRRHVTTGEHRQPGGKPLEPWLPLGKPEPGQEVMVCEGETDTLAALSAGVPMHVVGVPGASFPAERLAELVSGCNEVYLAFDPDEAGRKAEAAAVAAIPAPCYRVPVMSGDLADVLNGADDPLALLTTLINSAELVNPEQTVEAPSLPVRTVSGADFLLAPEQDAVAIWGQGQEILWASGEPLLICAAPGAGKTTIAQQVALARIKGGQVLGYPVQPERRSVLYVAADRPRQAARSWRRMISPADERLLAERLVVATAVDLADVKQLAEEVGAGTVFIDTLGAVTSDVEESGLRVYRQLKELESAGLEVCVLHHARKQGPERRSLRLDDVYGSQWLGAAVGSALMIEKQSKAKGFMRQEKSPAEPVYMRLYHDHSRGHTDAERWEPEDE